VSCKRAPETRPREVGTPSPVRVATIVGYAVDYTDGSITLENVTFEDGLKTKNLILYKYTGTPGQKRIEKGFKIIPKK
jgi:hypothetical protein